MIGPSPGWELGMQHTGRQENDLRQTDQDPHDAAHNPAGFERIRKRMARTKRLRDRVRVQPNPAARPLLMPRRPSPTLVTGGSRLPRWHSSA